MARVWKRFRADRRRMLLRDEVARLTARLRGRGDVGWRWALRDVSLRVEPGESVGLVGANGSGKTTLLRILARVMYPYAGRVEVSGRVGALIEIRAGIHPDLTGRENVFIMGSILGLPRREVARRFDDIVAFAEFEDAIDRQVKYFSSGMQMRLGFAIAAFLEPDVLLVDEVLAVGDASFQQRCLDRMRALLVQGTTLVFVSHDLAAVEAMCSRGVWLRHGRVEADGPVRDVVGAYRRSVRDTTVESGPVSGAVRLLKVEAGGAGGQTPFTQGPFEVRAVLRSAVPRSGVLYVGVSEGPATPIFVLRRDLHLNGGETEARCLIPRLPLPRGRYALWAGMFDVTGRDLLAWHPVAHFDVAGADLDEAPKAIVRLAPVHVEASWEVAQR
ncbi:MAG TPA: ABC transporter ATP-binding protein [Actinomycetota bacterium]|nr:ABC transporter ATP-binding protein [Actinomycetota bacterium]